MLDKNTIVSQLIAGKNKIFNLRVKVGTRKFQLAGVGSKTIKVRPTRLPDYPNLELVGFIKWSDWEKLSQSEKQLIEAFHKSLD